MSAGRIVFSYSAGAPSRAAADVLVLPVYAGEAAGVRLPALGRRALGRLLASNSFAGEWGEAVVLATHTSAWGRARLGASFVAAVGLGRREADAARQAEGLRRGLGRVAQEARRHSVRRLAVDLAGVTNMARMAAAVSDGVYLADYRFVEYSAKLRGQHERTSLRSVMLLLPQAEASAARQAITRSAVVMRGVALARDLVNRPAGEMTPKDLVAQARHVAALSPAVAVRVLNRRQSAQAGFSAFLAVARGSVAEPYVIHLIYRPPRHQGGQRAAAVLPRLFLVGKGITFDSGGLSLKPAQYMEDMKIDMAGAGAVLGLFSILPELEVQAEVHGVIATCENMPSGSAFRPGDIVRAKSGATIEVLNTDAEGRITLADALFFAAEHRPTAIIDLATLTSSCMAALGETVAGLWATDAALRERLLAAAQAAGEGLNSLPLTDEYRPLMDSSVADLRNVSAVRNGDAVMAALFLREFTGGVPWAHLDIAGPAFCGNVVLPYFVKGATGYGVRTLAEYLGVRPES